MELGIFWKTALAVAGLAAVASFVFWSLYKHWLRLPIFSTLTTGQQYRLLRLFLVLTFGFAVAALAAYIALQMKPQETADSGSKIIVSPVDEAPSLTDSFPLKMNGPIPANNVRLDVKAESLGLNFPVSVKEDMYPYMLLTDLIQHFSLNEHARIDTKLYPTGLKGGFWYSEWSILLNGSVVGREFFDRSDKTFGQLGAKNGDRINLKVSWSLGMTVSSDGGDRTAEVAKQPPPIAF